MIRHPLWCKKKLGQGGPCSKTEKRPIGLCPEVKIVEFREMASGGGVFLFDHIQKLLFLVNFMLHHINLTSSISINMKEHSWSRRFISYTHISKIFFPKLKHMRCIRIWTITKHQERKRTNNELIISSNRKLSIYITLSTSWESKNVVPNHFQKRIIL